MGGSGTDGSATIPGTHDWPQTVMTDQTMPPERPRTGATFHGPGGCAAVSASSSKEWLAAHPPPDSAFQQTLALVAARVLGGEELRFAAREFLDEFTLLPRDDLRARAITARPEPTGDIHAEAYLGALGEHLAVTGGLDRPGWVTEAGRFLDRFWFVSDVAGFRALAIAQSPAAFRRRGIFISEGALQRV